MTVTRFLAILSLLGVVVSAWLLWMFDNLWPDFDRWDRALAVLLVAAVWGFVAASVATVRKAFKRIDGLDREPQGATRAPHGIGRDEDVMVASDALEDARGDTLEVRDRVLA